MEAFPDEPFPELRQGVRRLLERFPETYWRELDEREAYPEEFVRTMTEAGYLAALIPEAYGGAGLGIQEASVILEEVHRAGGNAAACHAQMYILGALVRHGSEEQKARYLPKLARGELRLQAFGVTEPDAGSDTLSIRTFAERRGDRYVIHGQKIWTSRALYSDLMLLLARTTPPDQVRRRGEGLSLFLVNLKENLGKTIHIRPIKTMINHHTTEVFLDGLEVPVEDRIGEEGEGFRYILDGMNAERILIAAECIGDGYYFIRKAAEYARERWVFGRPIGQNQGIQFPLAQAYARIRAADLMRFRAAERYDQGLACGPEANMAKLLAAEASWEAANAALQTFGGFGFAKEFHIERKFRETRLYQVAPVSTNLILAYLAHNVLGLPKSY
ncbi:acyl-CoA dehydrogenase [Thermus scotoductus]|uniref:Acyl-CoA dehydrogenase n=1 Tax=Thermus scotoductus TaxID=37636 RepID=A0A430V6J6_THESC|nr:acyl-CoA dehydrogenase family protein [Thermus scotoductus]RTI02478.1 acyl-CoA dehydrogenase [Thermus scotoductus]RTI20636.1 acyl-CoA dehydrogenase [Thermus scotoductus]